ncbi:hypothetical protein [Mucilaginibacter pedocola]|uniref:Uncharacterized protein n=1 Tax=Mucilaginibacter pedocola TaxID=1792845 RepID=A0A1S9PA63_9SPHI|nr:hypothetical protein [Mucilaginibacter pedocola]OOQ57717.1 hypothetical protein BC343_13055 [Mucilaginibacter pedocola]
MYVIACPNVFRQNLNEHSVAVKDAKQGERHAGHFKFLSRPRLILSKKSPLPVTPYFPQGGFSYSASVQTIQTAFTCAQPQTKAQLSVGVNQLFCRWLV